jgi:hypothetical protein
MILVILIFFPFYYFHSLKIPMNVTISDQAIKAAAATMNLALSFIVYSGFGTLKNVRVCYVILLVYEGIWEH